jgi:hypothetical protein
VAAVAAVRPAGRRARRPGRPAAADGHDRLLGSATGDWLIRRVTATWTIRIGLLVETGLHLVSPATVAQAYAEPEPALSAPGI